MAKIMKGENRKGKRMKAPDGTWQCSNSSLWDGVASEEIKQDPMSMEGSQENVPSEKPTELTVLLWKSRYVRSVEALEFQEMSREEFVLDLASRRLLAMWASSAGQVVREQSQLCSLGASPSWTCVSRGLTGYTQH